MTFDAGEILVPGNGNVYVGPTTADAPTSASSSLDSDFQDLGYLSESGVAVTPGITIQDINVWQSPFPARRNVSARTFDVGIEMMQWNEDTLALYLGGATVTGSSPNFTVTPPDPSLLDTRSFVFDGIDGTRKYRLYIPEGMVSEAGEVSWVRTAGSALPITISALASGTVDAYKWFVGDAEFEAAEYP